MHLSQLLILSQWRTAFLGFEQDTKCFILTLKLLGCGLATQIFYVQWASLGHFNVLCFPIFFFFLNLDIIWEKEQKCCPGQEQCVRQTHVQRTRPFQNFQKLPASGVAKLNIPCITNLYYQEGGCSRKSILAVKVKQQIFKFSNINFDSWVNSQWVTGLQDTSQNHCHVCSMINFDTFCQLFWWESIVADLSPVSFLLPASQQLCLKMKNKPCQN